MSNYDTEKAITDNLASIITSTLGMTQEDTSGGQGTATAPLCVLQYRGLRFEDLYGNRMTYNEMDFNLVVSFQSAPIATARDRMEYWKSQIRTAVKNATNLNIGDLVTSKLVSRVAHDGADTDYSDPPLAVINYPLTIRYRET